MTIRQLINKTRTQLYAGAFLSWLGFVALLINEWLNKAVPPLFSALIFFALFMLFNIALIFGIKCPRCKNVLGDKLNWPPGKFFGFSSRIKYCPFCGVELDVEFPPKSTLPAS